MPLRYREWVEKKNPPLGRERYFNFSDKQLHNKIKHLTPTFKKL